MPAYESNEIVTFYFIIINNKGDKRIQAWTDNKEYAKIYLEFHNSKNLSIKKLTKPLKEMRKILEENANDKIQIAPRITIKNRDKKNKHDEDFKTVAIPITRTELTFINEEVATFMMTTVGYSQISEMMPLLKNKYQKALHDIFLDHVIRKVIYQQNNNIVQSIKLDELLVLFKSFPYTFDK